MEKDDGKVVQVTYSEERSIDSEIWLYRIIERIVIDSLEIDPIIKGGLLRSNQKYLNKIYERRE